MGAAALSDPSWAVRTRRRLVRDSDRRAAWTQPLYGKRGWQDITSGRGSFRIVQSGSGLACRILCTGRSLRQHLHDHCFVLLCALLLDAMLAEPGWLWSRVSHPPVLMGRLIGWMDRRFNQGSARRMKGVACLIALVFIGVGTRWLLSLAGSIFEIRSAAILLAQRSLVDHVAAVATGLRQSLAEGRAQVAMIVSRATSQMNESAVARAAIESAAENLSDGVIAPAFWFLVGGLRGVGCL